ncbi:MAG: hypothetical protein ABH869_06330 [Candidatus Omnitrophota bacterium]
MSNSVTDGNDENNMMETEKKLTIECADRGKGIFLWFLRLTFDNR